MHRSQFILRSVVLVSLVLTTATTAHASAPRVPSPDRFVATTGSDTSNDCSLGGSPCLTVGHAIAQSLEYDIISIAAGKYVENLDVSKSLTLWGAEMDTTLLDGGGAGTVLNLSTGETLNIRDLTVQNGNSAGSTGGIVTSTDTALILDYVRVSGNRGTFAGGMAITGALTMTYGEVSGNTTTGGGAGGISFTSPYASSLTNVNISGNTAVSSAGGILVQGVGPLNMTNVTMGGNRSAGASALSIISGAAVSLLNSTIADNTSSGVSAAIVDYGTILIKNTVVSGNSPRNCTASMGSTWTSLGNNLDSGTTCGFASAGDLSSTDPLLGIAGNYGGPMSFMPLLTGSPAIDTGSNTGCPATDARGIGRAIDGNNDAVAVCDMGAVEMKQNTTTTSITDAAPSPARVGDSVSVSVTVTGSFTTPTGSVEVTGGDSSCSITLASGAGSCSISSPRSGFWPIFAVYTGDSTHDLSQQGLSHTVLPPAPVDFDGDYVSDIIVYRGGAWLSYGFSTGLPGGSAWTGNPGGACIPAPMDYDGNGSKDPTQLCGNAWHFYNLDGSYNKGIWVGAGGGTAVPADYNGDGTDEVVLFRSGAWQAYDFATGAYLPGSSVWTGNPGGAGIPAPMDYNGDGMAEPTILSGGAWHFYNPNGSYKKGIWVGNVAGQLPVPGDYDADGFDDVVVFRGGAWLFYDRSTGAPLPGKDVWTGAPPPPAGGGATKPAPLDYDGDGELDFTVFAGGPWHFYNDNGSYLKGIWVGKNVVDRALSRRPLP